MSIKINYNDFYKAVNGEDDEKKDKKVSDARAELEEKLNRIQEEYDKTTTRTYGDNVFSKLVDKTYDALSDEEIEKIAKENISEREWKEKAKKIEKDAEEKKDNLQKKSEEISKRADEQMTKLDEKTENAKKEVDDEALKRGIGRSSIVMEEKNSLDQAKINAEAEILSNELSDLDDIDKKIANLENDLKDSFENLEIEKAAEIAKNIKALKDERQKKIDEVEAYNEKQRTTRQNALNRLAKKGIDVSEEGSKEYIERTGSMVKELYAYYKSLGSSASKEIVKDKEFIEDKIGENGYYYIKSFF